MPWIRDSLKEIVEKHLGKTCDNGHGPYMGHLRTDVQYCVHMLLVWSGLQIVSGLVFKSNGLHNLRNAVLDRFSCDYDHGDLNYQISKQC